MQNGLWVRAQLYTPKSRASQSTLHSWLWCASETPILMQLLDCASVLTTSPEATATAHISVQACMCRMPPCLPHWEGPRSMQTPQQCLQLGQLQQRPYILHGTCIQRLFDIIWCHDITVCHRHQNTWLPFCFGC